MSPRTRLPEAAFRLSVVFVLVAAHGSSARQPRGTKRRESEVSDAENLSLARQYLSCLSAGVEPEELEAFLSPDVVQEEFPNRLTPHGATRDLQAMKDGCARGNALLKEQAFEVVHAVASDQAVAMEVVWTGTVRGAAGPFSAGQTLRARFALFLEFREGRIVRQRNYDCFDPW